jgi:hypothetical protein
MGHGPNSSTLVVVCVVRLFLCCSMYCLCVNVYCPRVTTQFLLINYIIYHINYEISFIPFLPNPCKAPLCSSAPHSQMHSAYASASLWKTKFRTHFNNR